MSVDEIVRDVGRAISLLPSGQVGQALYALTEAHELLMRVIQGSQDPEAHQAVGLLAEVITALGATHQQVTAAGQALEQYLAKVGPVEPPPPPNSRPEPLEAANPPATPVPVDPARVEKLRDELPPPVPSPNPENKKTHGQWVDVDGTVRRTVSGEDEQSAAAWERFKQCGLPANRKLAITTHVEVKVATEMIQTGQRHTELVINNRPCVGPLGCDSLLPVLLPKGYAVTVYGPDGYKETFQGGEQW
ncbi:DddA-like double-stranded DNA deaminase toxin [Amycolatopsis alkalitolerans]|uniref:SCP1.201-like deaminase n=1 Tax=Amycolatopsis alkalitolerans TaxID=2547244 RepID=A0A5C4LZC2_9PSEU|nr:DddA-like double-stranded DNA deaminase toxin [Amycolatopsis alkalitolerans]TNC23724.1 hypothetical protein FG385_20385 [Amycolatopsis alkalitolerans]